MFVLEQHPGVGLKRDGFLQTSSTSSVETQMGSRDWVLGEWCWREEDSQIATGKGMGRELRGGTPFAFLTSTLNRKLTL